MEMIPTWRYQIFRALSIVDTLGQILRFSPHLNNPCTGLFKTFEEILLTRSLLEPVYHMWCTTLTVRQSVIYFIFNKSAHEWHDAVSLSQWRCVLTASLRRLSCSRSFCLSLSVIRPSEGVVLPPAMGDEELVLPPPPPPPLPLPSLLSPPRTEDDFRDEIESRLQ